MTARFVIVVAAALCLQSAVATADIPDATRSYVDPVLVGNSSGHAIGAGFTVISRDLGGTPQPGKAITLRFAGSGVLPCSEQDSATTVDCSSGVVTRTTGLYGIAVFHLRAGGFDNGASIQVRSEGMLLKTVPARTTDINADGKTDLEDLRLFRTNLLSRPDAPETDYDLDGRTTLKDLAILRGEIEAGASGTLCPW